MGPFFSLLIRINVYCVHYFVIPSHLDMRLQSSVIQNIMLYMHSLLIQQDVSGWDVNVLPGSILAHNCCQR